jgi:hypothetical protein
MRETAIVLVVLLAALPVLPCGAGGASTGARAPPPTPVHLGTLEMPDFSGASLAKVALDTDGTATLEPQEWAWGSEMKATSGTDFYRPAVAGNSNGVFLAVFNRYVNILSSNVYAQRFNIRGALAGEPMMLNDPGARVAADPDVAVDSRGNFLAVWLEYGTSSYDIVAQRFDPDGNLLGTVFTVTAAPDTQAAPAIAVNSKDEFLVAWEDLRGGSDYDIYAQRLNSSGSRLGFEIQVATGARNQTEPALAVDQNDNFTITWTHESSSTNKDIYAQRFGPTGIKNGPNFAVAQGPRGEWSSTVATTSRNDIIVAWQEYDTVTSWNIGAQRLDAGGNKLGEKIQVCILEGAQTLPSVAVDSRDDALVVWMDERGTEPAIVSQLVDRGGNLLGPATNATGGASRRDTYPSLANAPQDRIMMVWAAGTNSTTSRHVWASLFHQPYPASGTLTAGPLAPEALFGWSNLSAGFTVQNATANSVSFGVSTDGGSVWQAVPANGSLSAAGGARSLHIRATLSSSDPLTTPVLNNITLSYIRNMPPSVSAPATTSVKKGREVTLSANGTDADQGDAASLTYTWNQTSGKALGLTNLTGRNLTFKPASAGKYTFTVVASDGFASSAPATVTLSVSEDKKADEGLPITPIVGAVIGVAVVIGILAAMMMRRKPTTVIQYQPPPEQPYNQPPAPPPQAAPYAPLPAPAQQQIPLSNAPTPGSMGVAATSVPTPPQPANLPPSLPPQGAESQPYPPTNP